MVRVQRSIDGVVPQIAPQGSATVQKQTSTRADSEPAARRFLHAQHFAAKVIQPLSQRVEPERLVQTRPLY